MKKVGVTGINTFLGRHAVWLFNTLKEEIEVIDLDKNFVEVDVVLHLASLSPKEIENPDNIYDYNVGLATKLIKDLEEAKITPYIIFASSTQINKDNPYGKSKKFIGKMLREWGDKNNSFVTNAIIPNEFGEGGIAYKTSVVSTFCEELVQGKESQVGEGSVSLIHAQEVVRAMLELLRNPKNQDVELEGVYMEVMDLYKKLKEFKEAYYNDTIPNLENGLDLALFNNLRWHILDSGFYPRKLVLRTDDRGSLFEMIKENTGGQTFASTTKPGVTRGNHYHTRKIERFCVLKGEAEICFRRVGTEKILKYKVSGNEPVYIDMPTFYTHNITNIGSSELLTLFWTNEIFNPQDTDTFMEPV